MRLEMQHWVNRLIEFVPLFVRDHARLAPLGPRLCALLHGSTTMGIDDPYSDLDNWLLMPMADLAVLEGSSFTRFFSFTLDDKKGHFNAESFETFDERMTRCDMDVIRQLRSAVALFDPENASSRLIERACLSMPETVSTALFMHHYVAMRREHRACDNPMERGDPVATLLAMTKAITHALRAAMVLDGEPYPYDKWLYQTAARTPIGRQVNIAVDQILGHLGADDLHYGGPESSNPISMALRDIRRALVEAARERGRTGLDGGRWLDRWWEYIPQADAAIMQVRWPSTASRD
jgi:hypothetical protein